MMSPCDAVLANILRDNPSQIVHIVSRVGFWHAKLCIVDASTHYVDLVRAEYWQTLCGAIYALNNALVPVDKRPEQLLLPNKPDTNNGLALLRGANVLAKVGVDVSGTRFLSVWSFGGEAYVGSGVTPLSALYAGAKVLLRELGRKI